MHMTEWEFRSSELKKNVKIVETKDNTLSEASEELHCLSGASIAKKIHITNSNLLRVEYAIKVINNAKGLIPPPPEAEIVAKLSRHYSDDIRTAIITLVNKIYNLFFSQLRDNAVNSFFDAEKIFKKSIVLHGQKSLTHFV